MTGPASPAAGGGSCAVPPDTPGGCGQQRQRRTPRRQPAWADWAHLLARQLQRRWTWLAGVKPPAVAAVLGAALGNGWTADDVVRYVAKVRRGRQLLTNPAAPLGYLKQLLDDVLGDLKHTPPHPAARHTLTRRRAAEDDAAVLRAHQATAAAAATEQAAAAAPAADNPAVAAARAKLAAEAATRAAHARTDTERRTAAARAALAACDWP